MDTSVLGFPRRRGEHRLRAFPAIVVRRVHPGPVVRLHVRHAQFFLRVDVPGVEAIAPLRGIAERGEFAPGHRLVAAQERIEQRPGQLRALVVRSADVADVVADVDQPLPQSLFSITATFPSFIYFIFHYSQNH